MHGDAKDYALHSCDRAASFSQRMAQLESAPVRLEFAAGEQRLCHGDLAHCVQYTIRILRRLKTRCSDVSRDCVAPGCRGSLAMAAPGALGIVQNSQADSLSPRVMRVGRQGLGAAVRDFPQISDGPEPPPISLTPYSARLPALLLGDRIACRNESPTRSPTTRPLIAQRLSAPQIGEQVANLLIIQFAQHAFGHQRLALRQ